jgi:hypothetical protein
MRMGSVATAAKNVKCCTGEGRHKIGCKRKGRGFPFVSTSGIAKSLMPTDEPKHGGVAEPFRRYMKSDVKHEKDEEK